MRGTKLQVFQLVNQRGMEKKYLKGSESILERIGMNSIFDEWKEAWELKETSDGNNWKMKKENTFSTDKDDHSC